VAISAKGAKNSFKKREKRKRVQKKEKRKRDIT
jgi:hypothetical protein